MIFENSIVLLHVLNRVTHVCKVCLNANYLSVKTDYVYANNMLKTSDFLIFHASVTRRRRLKASVA